MENFQTENVLSKMFKQNIEIPIAFQQNYKMNCCKFVYIQKDVQWI